MTRLPNPPNLSRSECSSFLLRQSCGSWEKTERRIQKFSWGGSDFACAGEVEFGDTAPAVMTTGLDDHVDGVLDVLDHVRIGHRDLGLEGCDREALHGQLRRFGVKRGHGTAMAGVDR